MISGSSMAAGFGDSSCRDEETECEVRPGGMMVQKRSDCQATTVVHHIRVHVAYGAVRHEISVDQQETFGGLKRLLTAKTGLRPEEQKLVFRGRERGDGSYLDTSGVKDRSKVVLVQDPLSIEKRYVEMRRDAKIRTTRQAIADVSVEIDKLAEQVSIVEKSIAKGKKVPEVQITTLIEMLMRQAVKLDNISAEGDDALSKNSQGKKVQACVEALDHLMVSNTKIKPVVVTTTWETFDESPALANNPRRTGPWNYLIDLQF
ncbi:hypothetical protein MLD38_039289 [Melastoma candidum]|uniref:Uncharacterized protein n=2 Tax=Melastoma candidum TaxID=119954 RepID=A0ACB9L2C5_9MYRT|nr:hypothetical protein MLD38_039284 [Melastoma candidum]KAI4303689.1 hypothetical protein MLD38_039289 [Melastoma candidum]